MKNWIQAARLRTLPLSLSGIILGSAYAYHQGFYDYRILGLALLTTLGLQSFLFQKQRKLKLKLEIK